MQKRGTKLNEVKKIISISCADVKNKNNVNSNLETQCLFGDEVSILKKENNWSLCKLNFDGYIGWIKNTSLDHYFETDHLISKIQSFAYKKPSHNAGVFFALYLNSKIKVLEKLTNWVKIKLNKNEIAFVPISHIRKQNSFHLNFMEIAQMFENSPYLWGGKTVLGLDCSGLIQTSLQASNLIVPRNTIDQLNYRCDFLLDVETIEEECLIFWKGHVALTLKNNKLIHSNSYHMSVVIEDTSQTIERIFKTDGKVIGLRKIII